MKLLSALLFTPLLFAADLPSADKLLQLSLERSGGAQALAKAKNAFMTGTVEMAGHNISGPVSLFQEGSKSYTVIDIPGIGKVEEGFDGETAWEMNALQGARIKDGEERAEVERSSKSPCSAPGAITTRKAGRSARKTWRASPPWKVQMIPKEGKPEIFYFDKDRCCWCALPPPLRRPLGDIPVDALMGDYRMVDGIKTPFTLTQKAMSQVLVMRFDTVQYNAPIPANRFDLPLAVKALAAKQKRSPQ